MMPETDAQPEHPLSLQKAKWVLPDVSLDDVQAITREHDIPELIARILKLRGIAADDISGGVDRCGTDGRSSNGHFR
jgi:hypothetical protein